MKNSHFNVRLAMATMAGLPLGSFRSTLFLVLLFGSWAAITESARAQTTLKVLHTFSGIPHDGAEPTAGLTPGPSGYLYGTTSTGGTSNLGTVFKVDTSGRETVLYSFSGGTSGWFPFGGVIRDSSGNLYGTAYLGGISGAGIVFALDTANRATVLYSFTGGADGGRPVSGVVRDAEGNLYGTTAYGGNMAACGSLGCGTVFEVDSTGRESVLYAFVGAPNDGEGPVGVIRDSAGNLYGTTCCGDNFGAGIVFKVDSNSNETVLHSFGGLRDGGTPGAGVIQDSSGNLYGTTLGGSGASSGLGIVFKIDPSEKETILYAFPGGAANGVAPDSSLIRDSAGNLYGTTLGGGAYGSGTVFKLDRNNNETVLYSFTGGSDGGSPVALTRDSLGNLYGTTQLGGDMTCNFEHGCGTVFELTFR